MARGVIQRAVSFLSVFTQHSMMRPAECPAVLLQVFQLVTFSQPALRSGCGIPAPALAATRLDMAAFFSSSVSMAPPARESSTPGAGVAAVVPSPVSLSAPLRGCDGRQGVLHQAGLFKMGRSGLGRPAPVSGNQG
nr:hypothetical protein [Klebsiella pneumoniae]